MGREHESWYLERQSFKATITKQQARIAELEGAAQEVMDTLAEHGPSIVPHLLDTDDNAGQRLRELLNKGGSDG